MSWRGKREKDRGTVRDRGEEKYTIKTHRDRGAERQRGETTAKVRMNAGTNAAADDARMLAAEVLDVPAAVGANDDQIPEIFSAEPST